MGWQDTQLYSFANYLLILQLIVLPIIQNSWTFKWVQHIVENQGMIPIENNDSPGY